MGVIKRGILGGFANSVANIVGSSWKGIAVIKSKPLSVANPRTAAQVAQRDAFSAIVAVAVMLLVPNIKPLWDRFAQLMSGFNAFVRANIANFELGGIIDPNDFILAQGSLTAVPLISGTASAATQIVTVNWNDNSGSGTAQISDTIYIAIYDTGLKAWFNYAPAFHATRNAGTVPVTVTGIVQGTNIFAYVAFRRADGTLVSNTVVDEVTVGA